MAFLHGEFVATPGDAVGSEAGEPDDEVDGVTEGDEPEFLADDLVADAPDTDGPGHGQTQDEVGSEIGGANPMGGSYQGGKNRPR